MGCDRCVSAAAIEMNQSLNDRIDSRAQTAYHRYLQGA
ncbi:hypothetical protein ALO75_102923 [Pseudomonas syringae pv. coryli]|uniref:Uncharacterized protein n=1 Tax=Pseudomonas syringae pv. coryli TaxID=317659 RepID=A0A0P9MJ38_9PSED|nr:Unknown protein sequence [Pseudomonas syringae pv. syringae]KPW91980.1 hypothetical protein ALO75_102923 [Pseudomonas syringae pv. coryli]KPY36210.1 hypothetical protein ALO65_102121 [Pseudomonas syringae pv. papulans]RMM38160.1 hypothetical protein ALQ78_101574 [Pseudomonas syringae pv. aptata]RMS22441.1 hypothetical protein ALP69_102051 [Pseudomonas syringae pv. aceris]